MITFHYAMQVCDTKSNQGRKRYCGDDRTLLSKKSITSLCQSILYCINQNNETVHYLNLIVDDASSDLNNFLNNIKKKYSSVNFIIEINTVTSFGIMNSIRDCYKWLCKNGEQFVFQVQDDYLFCPSAIYEMTDIWFQLFHDTQSDILIQPFNEGYHWTMTYKYQSNPRAIVAGKKRYWVQIYDISCSFMTSVFQLRDQWDLCEKFCNMDSLSTRLEADSLNHIMTKRGVLCLTPIQSLSLHMQSELEKDPYIDWKSWWDSIDVDL